MHALTFALKRAHLKNVAHAKSLMWAVPGMTPARLDLLCILKRAVANEHGWGPLDAARSQADLCKDLGLHRSTVSKMLIRLQEMGWIRRDRDSADRRTMAVGLTETGLEMITVAMHQ